MANKNRNRRSDQSWQQNQDWEQNRQRINRESDYSRDYENYGSESLGDTYDQSRHMGTGYGSGNVGNTGYGRYDAYRPYRPERDYGYNKNVGQYGNYGSASYGNQYRDEYDWQRQRTLGSSYDPDYNRQDWHESRNPNYGGPYGSTYGESNFGMQRTHQPRNRYGGDTSNYGNANQGGIDRDWWERTRDEVSSWFGDDDAKRRRRMDRQFAGSHRGKGPKGYQRSDDRIREDINDRLSDDPFIDASDIEVKVEDSVAILSGNVENREDKRRAEDIVERVLGVKDVENRLRVTPERTASGYSVSGRGDREIEL